MSASRAFREAIARQTRTQERIEVRLSTRSTCDFCALREPSWYYDCPEIGLNIRTGEAFVLDQECPASGIVHRFDKGWMACDVCMPLIEAEDGEAILRRWRENEEAFRKRGYREAREIAEARNQIARVHRLFFEHRRGPEPIYES